MNTTRICVLHSLEISQSTRKKICINKYHWFALFSTWRLLEMMVINFERRQMKAIYLAIFKCWPSTERVLEKTKWLKEYTTDDTFYLTIAEMGSFQVAVTWYKSTLLKSKLPSGISRAKRL